MDLDAIRAGDTGALRRLLDDAWAPLVRYLASLSDSPDAAQDAAQEAFVRLWERRERWRGGSARAVLFRIGRNVALDQARRAEVRHRKPPVDPMARRPATPDDELRAARTRGRVSEALAALPPRRREVFELVRFDGLAYREVADVLGLSPQTVANQMSLALRDLRTLLADLAPGVDPAHETDPDSAADRGARDRRSGDG